MRRIRFWSVPIIILPMAAMLAASVVFLVKEGRYAMTRLPDVVRSAVTQRVNGTVRIGGVETYPFGVRLTDVSIYENDAGSGGPSLQAPEVRVVCSLSDILFRRKDPAASVQRIDVLRPRVILRRAADGTWNVTRLLKPTPARRPSKFAAPIYVLGADVTVRDGKPRAPKVEVNHLTDVDAIVETKSQPSITFRAAANGARGRLRRLALRGTYVTTSHAIDVQLDAEDANAEYFTQYPFHTGVTALSGMGDVRVSLSKPAKDRPLEYDAHVRLSGASMRVPLFRRPATGVSGEVRIAKDAVDLDLQGRVGSSPVRVTGCVADLKHPYLALHIRSDSANLREVIGLSNWSGALRTARLPASGSVDAQLYGQTKSLAASFSVFAPSFGIGPFEATDVRGHGSYAAHRIVIDQISCRSYGGFMQASGLADLSKVSGINLNGSGSGIRLGLVPRLGDQGVTGATSGDINFAWHPGDLRVSYDGRLRDCRARALRFDDGVARGEYHNGDISIDELSARAFRGAVTASGEIDRDGSMNLRVSGADINLGQLGGQTKRLPIVGRAQFSGSVRGTVASPVFDGGIEAYRTVISGVEIERAVARLIASRQSVDLSRLTIYDGPGRVKVSGRILNPLAMAPGLHLKLGIDYLNVDKLADAAGFSVMPGGRLNADLTISGTPRGPRVEGAVRVQDASYGGVDVDSAGAKVEYWNRSIHAEKLEVRAAEAVLTGRCDIGGDRSISGDFAAHGVPLARLAAMAHSSVSPSGAIDVSGRVTGTMRDPRVEAAVEARHFVLNGQSFTGLHGKAVWANGTVLAREIGVKDGDSSLDVPELNYSSSDRTVTLQASAHGWEGGKLVAMLEACPSLGRTDGRNAGVCGVLSKIPRPFSGVIDADVKGSVRLADDGPAPDISVDLSVGDMKYGHSSLESLKLAGSWHDRTINLDRLDVIDGDTNVSADGSYNPSQLALRLDAHNLNTDVLREWVRLPDNFSGRADVTIVAGGSPSSPSAEAYVELVDPVLSGIKFDRLRARLSAAPDQSGTPGQDRIDINEVTLALGSHDFKASGYVPVDWKRFTIPAEAPIFLESKLDADNLKLLSAITGLSVENGAGGSFGGSIRLAGSISAPKLDGDLTWRNGLVHLPRISSDLTKIDADIVLSGSSITIAKLNGASSDGGGFSIDGGVSFTGMRPSLNLGVSARDLRIAGRNITNVYDEDVSAQISGALKVTGDLRKPLIAGSLSVPSGTITLPNKPAKPREPVRLAYDPRFDGKVSLGRDVRIRSARLKTPLYGNLSVVGTLSGPVVDGVIDISDGSIAFPMRSFKILPGSSLQVHLGAFQAPVMQVDMQAQSRITAGSPLGQSKPYTIVMAARGPLDKLSTSFSSSPPGLSEDDIVGLVTGQQQLQQILTGNGKGEIAKELSGLFSTAMMPTVFDPIERAFEKALGFEEFALDMGYQEPLRLTIGDSLWGGLHLSYSAVLGARPDYVDNLYQLRLSYRFKHGLEMGIETDQKNDIGFIAEGRMRF